MTSTPLQPSSRHSRSVAPLGVQNSMSADVERSRRAQSRTEAELADRESALRATHRRKNASPIAEISSVPIGEAGSQRRNNPRAVPDYFNDLYLRVGRNFHLPSGEVAIIDRGRVLKTPLENKTVTRHMLTLHQERGENAVVVAGSEHFRREAWLAATSRGMEVRGYQPTTLEAQLPRVLAHDRDLVGVPTERPQEIDANGVERPARPDRLELVEEAHEINPERAADHADPRVRSGRLVEHGEAHYQFDRRKPLSYYVKVDTPQGEVTQWGADLSRAMKQSLSGARSGDDVVLRHLGVKPVTVTRPIRNAQGEIVRKEEVKARLNRWSVERVDFIEDRARLAAIVRNPSIDAAAAVSQRPELAGTYAELHDAKRLAPQLYLYPRDQASFLTRLREALADEIQRGEALSAPRARDRRPEPGSESSRPQDRAQERVLS